VNGDFSLQIGIDGKSAAQDATKFFKIDDPAPTNYSFTYTEDLFARDNRSLTGVNVIAKSYRSVALYEPGKYTVRLAMRSYLLSWPSDRNR
jgi:hypothetical protein